MQWTNEERRTKRSQANDQSLNFSPTGKRRDRVWPRETTYTLGVSAASRERSFSCLKRLKTFLRANNESGKIDQHGTALLAMERDLYASLDLEKAL